MSQSASTLPTYILPERAVDLAWGLTLAYSSSKDDAVITSADDLRNRLKQIQTDMQQTATKRDNARDEIRKALEEAIKGGNRNAAQLEKLLETAEASCKDANKDLTYIENVISAITACNRNLLTIVRGRNQNFEQTDRLMASQIANIESSARLTANLQSVLPRAFATGGGASGTIVVNYILDLTIHYTLPVEVLAAVATIAAGCVYALYQWKIAPRNVVRSQQEIIKNNYRRDIYYRRYISRVVSTLSSLFDHTLSLYKKIYDQDYNPLYNSVEEREKVVWTALGGKEGICGKFCPLLNEHYLTNKITPERWALCQTGEGYKECKEWPKTQT